jgi:hypothetical protein
MALPFQRAEAGYFRLTGDGVGRVEQRFNLRKFAATAVARDSLMFAGGKLQRPGNVGVGAVDLHVVYAFRTNYPQVFNAPGKNIF